MAKTAEEIRAQLRAKREAAKKDLPAPVPAEADNTLVCDDHANGADCRQSDRSGEARESTHPLPTVEQESVEKSPTPTHSRGGQKKYTHDEKRAGALPSGRHLPAHPSQGKSEDMHRASPHSPEAEQGVIGSMVKDPRATIPEVVAHLNEDYFYVPANVIIYKAIVGMWDKGKAVDLITLTQHLIDVGQIDAAGGPFYVTSLFNFVPTSANVGYYLEIVREKYLLRQVIKAATDTVRRAYEEQDEVQLLLDEVEQTFIGIGDDRFSSNKLPTMKDNVHRAMEIIESCASRDGGLNGIATGFHGFDRMTGGLHDGEMTVIAARPSMGKTALVMNIAEHVAVEGKLPVAVFSLEMTTDQLAQRLMCSRARVNLQKAREGFLAERDITALITAGAKFSETKLVIDDASGLNILELKARARRMKAQHGIRLLIIDYLQLLRSNSKRGQENRQIEVTEISAGLKGLAKELKIPVVVAAQLNRQPEARQGGKPRLSDLRESGSIEQDADVVGLLIRQEVYEDDAEARDECAGEAKLIIAKQRNGPIGEIPLTFLKEFTRFEDRAREITQNEELT
jgi:replicative DNA helicase